MVRCACGRAGGAGGSGGSGGAGVTGSSESPDMAAGNHYESLQKQYVLFTVG